MVGRRIFFQQRASTNWSGQLVLALALGLAFVCWVLLASRVTELGPHTLLRSSAATSIPNMNEYKIGWLILPLCFAVATPLLAVLSKLPKFFQPHEQPLSHTSLSKDSDYAAANSVFRPNLLLHLVHTYIVKTFSSQQLFVACWVIVQLLALLLPFRWHMDEWYTHPKMWVRGRYMTHRIDDFDRFLGTIGFNACIPGVLGLGMALVPAAKVSAWLSIVGISFENGIKYHRWFAWSGAFWITVHALFMQIGARRISHQAWVDFMFLNPKAYNLSFIVTAGLISWLLILVMFFTALEKFRSRFYSVFLIVHFLFIPMLWFAVVHAPECNLYFLMGLVLYIADLAQRWLLRRAKVSMVLRVMGPSCIFCTIQSPNADGKWVKPENAGKFVYLKVPKLSQWEMHPFTIASIQPGEISLFIRASGDWTRKLYKLACEENRAPVDAEIEGPYGQAPLGRILDSDLVVLLAGGSGVSALSSLLQYLVMAASKTVHTPRVVFVWAVRQLEEVEVFRPLFAAAASAGMQITVHVTGRDLTINPLSGSDTENDQAHAKAPSWKIHNNAVADEEAPEDPPQSKAALPPAPPAESQRPNPAYLNWRMLTHGMWVPLFILLLTSGASFGGYIAGAQVAKPSYRLDGRDPRMVALSRNYTRNVRNLNATNPTLAKLQPAFQTFRIMEQCMKGSECQLCASCPNQNPQFPLGYPVPCCKIGIAIAERGIPALLSWVMAAAGAVLGCLIVQAVRGHFVHWQHEHMGQMTPSAGSVDIPTADKDDVGHLTTCTVSSVDVSLSSKHKDGQDGKAMPHMEWERPDVAQLLRQVVPAGSGHVMVCACGPREMLSSVQLAYDAHVVSASAAPELHLNRFYL